MPAILYIAAVAAADSVCLDMNSISVLTYHAQQSLIDIQLLPKLAASSRVSLYFIARLAQTVDRIYRGTHCIHRPNYITRHTVELACTQRSVHTAPALLV